MPALKKERVILPFIPPTICSLTLMAWIRVKNFASDFFKIHHPLSFSNLVIDRDRHHLNSERAWHINWALAQNAQEKTQDPILKNRIRFIGINYLNKVTPILSSALRAVSWNFFESLYQVSPFSNFQYYRTSLCMFAEYSEPINKSFALSQESPLILTDTVRFTQFLPFEFTVLDESNEEKWDSLITKTVQAHLAKFTQNRTAVWNEKLELGILFDLTSLTQKLIQTNGNSQKEDEFKTKFNEIKTRINRCIDRSIDTLLKENTSLDKNRLKLFIQKNTTCISRVEIEYNHNRFAGIKVLPLFFKVPINQLAARHLPLVEFIERTGILIGAINLRKLIPEAFPVPDEKINVKISSDMPLPPFFKKKEEVFCCQIVKRLTEKFKSGDFDSQPHVAVLGQTTMQLLDGLFKEIKQADWDSLNENPATREILQTALIQIKHHLASAEHEIQDYSHFSQAIELVHAEIATLLELFNPFQPEDFGPIYANQLRIIPETLKPFVQAGLGKTAVTVFAGINAIAASINPCMQAIFSKGFYYEQANFMGPHRTFKAALEDPNIKKIDLYTCSFNPNLDADLQADVYTQRDVIADIRELFLKKPETDCLTVAVDTTMDYFNSHKHHQLLATFENEIKQGKLNFIFSRSGQKFDLLGMDNYYGSPFYMVNNGAEHWSRFKDLMTEEVYQTDKLSLQWFCLVNRYASQQIDQYRYLIFDNTRTILSNLPESLKPDRIHPKKTKVATIDGKVEQCFIDFKIHGWFHFAKASLAIAYFYKLCVDHRVKSFIRASFGFYHPNTTLIFGKESTSLRLHPGINPEENKVILQFLHNLS